MNYEPSFHAATAQGDVIIVQKPRSCLKGLRNALLSSHTKVTDMWNRGQLGNRAIYSVERLLSFRDYCERTSRIRVYLVCLFTPAPALIVMLLIECIPLQSPEEGWRVNSMMWIRIFISSIFVGGGMIYLAQSFLKSVAAISMARVLAMTVTSAACYTAGGIFLAATWKYPIPFGMVLMVCPFSTFIMGLIVLSIGPRAIVADKKLRNELGRHILSASAQALLVVAYPTFNAVFLQLDDVEQALFVFVLPLIKFIAKQVTASVSTHIEDFIGAAIVFSVDVFNVLYMAICMQTARSLLTTLLVMTFDTFHIVLALRSVYIHTKTTRRQSKRSNLSANYVDRLVKSIERTKKPSDSIHLYGPINLPLSELSKLFLEKLQIQWGKTPLERGKSSPEPPAPKSIPHFSTLVKFSKPNHHQIMPETLANVRLTLKSQGTGIRWNTSRRTLGEKLSGLETEQNIEDGLQVLFHCEYVILAEYVECALPLFYAVYLTGLYQLPTAAFYPFTRSMTSTKMTSTLIQLVLYVSLEFVSFAGLHVLLKKRLGYSPVCQLAFVLETHAKMVQSLLFLWTIFIVQLTIVHAGVDLNAPFL